MDSFIKDAPGEPAIMNSLMSIMKEYFCLVQISDDNYPC